VSGETYFLIHCNEEPWVLEATEAVILDYLEKDDEGAVVASTFAPGESRDPDPNYWGGRSLIIRGEIVQPKPRTVKYELR
jgi:hypothetical protein